MGVPARSCPRRSLVGSRGQSECRRAGQSSPQAEINASPPSHDATPEIARVRSRCHATSCCHIAAGTVTEPRFRLEGRPNTLCPP